MNSIVYNSKKRVCEIKDLVDYYPAFIDFCTNRGIVFINDITEEDIIAFKLHYNVKLVDISYIRTILQNSDMPDTKSIMSPIPGKKTITRINVWYGQCRERCYNDSWIAKTGNIITTSTISKEHCINAHKKKFSTDAFEIIESEPSAMPIAIAKKTDTNDETNPFVNDKSLPFGKRLGMVSIDYESVILDYEGLSTRITNALKRIGIFNLGQLLNLSESEIRSGYSIGSKIADQIVDYVFFYKEQHSCIQSFSDDDTNNSTQINNISEIQKQKVLSHVNAYINDRTYTIQLNDNELQYYNECISAIDDIGDEIYMSVISDKKQWGQIISSLNKFCIASEIGIEQSKQLENLLISFPFHIYNYKVDSCINAYGKNVDLLKTIFSKTDYVINIPYATQFNYINNTDFEKILEFTEWISKLQQRIRNAIHFFETRVIPDELTQNILEMRSQNNTLQDCSIHFNLTRERIRQKQNKVLDRANEWERKYNLISIIIQLVGDGIRIDEDAVISVIGQSNEKTLRYICSVGDINGLVYNTQEKAYCHKSQIWYEVSNIKSCELLLDNIAEMFTFDDIISKRVELNIEISEENIRSYLNENINVYGNYYCKHKLTKNEVVDYILMRYFQKGYKINNEEHADIFRSKIALCFGPDNFILTNRALDALVSAIGVLCDRGTYIHCDYICVSSEVPKNIFEYIQHNTKNAITFSEIYDYFKDNLFVDTQITNRYIMQGVMKFYGCPYIMMRDYVTKDNTDITTEIETYIASFDVVNKYDIFSSFPGMNDPNLLAVASRCKNIIGLDNGLFMHSSKLVPPSNLQQIKHVITSSSKEIPVSTKKLLIEFNNMFPEFMHTNDIKTHGKLFGILKYYFEDEFNFSRPYIGTKTIKEIDHNIVLKMHLANKRELSIYELIRICKDNHIYLHSISSVLNGLNDTFMRVDSNRLVRVLDVGVTDAIVTQISNLVKQTVSEKGYISVRHINDFSCYPTLCFPWNEYLLEGISHHPKFSVQKILLPVKDVTQLGTVFCSDSFKGDDYPSLIHYAIEKRHSVQPFATYSEIGEWLTGEGLLTDIPQALLENQIVHKDDDGNIVIKPFT